MSWNLEADVLIINQFNIQFAILISENKETTVQKTDSNSEDAVLRCVSEVALSLPIDSQQLLINVNKTLTHPIPHDQIINFLRKIAVQQLIGYKY